ncbi:hypothetical protein SPBR_03290 [Sporothrix brasiliensis 5110]|uniref:Uncharacterized protein n=1 Tax=Sporothrix brasiliensis 5110 TaxID=1398154 RepID=A0A0C2IZJ6_9PEZI|nr:uncharacterized protein SPBR_03290 [Sporothrix brasiliensis 5110]KIH92135.1 hypothetical protein SPBR_03290 [Sporothrix brasiliensis 5110]
MECPRHSKPQSKWTIVFDPLARNHYNVVSMLVEHLASLRLVDNTHVWTTPLKIEDSGVFVLNFAKSIVEELGSSDSGSSVERSAGYFRLYEP